jgi:hypothetical protein
VIVHSHEGESYESNEPNLVRRHRRRDHFVGGTRFRRRQCHRSQRSPRAGNCDRLTCEQQHVLRRRHGGDPIHFDRLDRDRPGPARSRWNTRPHRRAAAAASVVHGDPDLESYCRYPHHRCDRIQPVESIGKSCDDRDQRAAGGNANCNLHAHSHPNRNLRPIPDIYRNDDTYARADADLDSQPGTQLVLHRQRDFCCRCDNSRWHHARARTDV